MYPRSSTATLVAAMHELANTIQCEDGVANAAIGEAAYRLAELDGHQAVFICLLVDCAAVIRTMKGENSDESKALFDLLTKIDMAIDPHRHQGALI